MDGTTHNFPSYFYLVVYSTFSLERKFNIVHPWLAEIICIYAHNEKFWHKWWHKDCHVPISNLVMRLRSPHLSWDPCSYVRPRPHLSPGQTPAEDTHHSHPGIITDHLQVSKYFVFMSESSVSPRSTHVPHSPGVLLWLILFPYCCCVSCCLMGGWSLVHGHYSDPVPTL